MQVKVLFHDVGLKCQYQIYFFIENLHANENFMLRYATIGSSTLFASLFETAHSPAAADWTNQSVNSKHWTWTNQNALWQQSVLLSHTSELWWKELRRKKCDKNNFVQNSNKMQNAQYDSILSTAGCLRLKF